MNELVLHRGAREVTREELSTVESPPETNTWKPLKHAVVLDAVEETLGSAGFVIEKSWLSLSQDKHRFFGVLHLGTSLAEGVNLSVGLRSSTDKSFPLGLVAGSKCFVCDNLSFSSEIEIARRHTINGERRFREAISGAMPQLGQFATAETNRISALRERNLDSQEADSLMLRSFETGIIGTRLLPKLIMEWREPRHEEFVARTAFSLLNAYTETVKGRFKAHPNRAAYEMQRFQSLLCN